MFLPSTRDTSIYRYIYEKKRATAHVRKTLGNESVITREEAAKNITCRRAAGIEEGRLRGKGRGLGVWEVTESRRAAAAGVLNYTLLVLNDF